MDTIITLTPDTIIHLAELIGAAGVIVTLIISVVKWFARQARQDDDIHSIRDEQQEIKAEQGIISYALLACLDGLKQLGANGNVTDAYNKLEKYLNKKAHDLE